MADTTTPPSIDDVAAPGEASPPRARRILLIVYEYPPLGGGTGKAARNTALTLVGMGFDVALVTSNFKGLRREEVDEGVRVFRIPVLRRHLNYANALEVVSFTLSGLLRASDVLKRFQPDLTLAYHTIPSGPIALALKRRSGVPFLTLLRGQDVPGHPELARWAHAMALPVTRLVWRRSARVIANSESLAELARRTAPELNFDVVRNGIDLELYHPPKRPASSEPAGFRLTYLGRLVTSKRLRNVLRAWAKISAETGNKGELCFVGFGPERPKLEALAQELKVADTVRFTGRIDESGVIEMLRASDALINMSEAEGLPNAVLEAMACALPVILSDVPAHKELIAERDCGILCDGDNVGDVAKAMLELARSPELRTEMGRTARGIVERDFSWQAATERLVELFPI